LRRSWLAPWAAKKVVTQRLIVRFRINFRMGFSYGQKP
jgi:hypothetical protein